jgi:hypothetical protein
VAHPINASVADGTADAHVKIAGQKWKFAPEWLLQQ